MISCFRLNSKCSTNLYLLHTHLTCLNKKIVVLTWLRFFCTFKRVDWTRFYKNLTSGIAIAPFYFNIKWTKKEIRQRKQVIIKLCNILHLSALKINFKQYIQKKTRLICPTTDECPLDHGKFFSGLLADSDRMTDSGISGQLFSQ